jgi:hypothetical protein
MVNAAQHSKSGRRTPARSASAGETGVRRQRSVSSRAVTHLNNSTFRWIAIVVVTILLWLIGADWRTLVMIAAAAAMFAMAIDQIENVSGR